MLTIADPRVSRFEPNLRTCLQAVFRIFLYFWLQENCFDDFSASHRKVQTEISTAVVLISQNLNSGPDLGAGTFVYF